MIDCKRFIKLVFCIVVLSLLSWNDLQAQQFTLRLHVTGHGCCVGERIVVWTVEDNKIHADLPLVGSPMMFDIKTNDDPHQYTWKVRYEVVSCVCWIFENTATLNIPYFSCGEIATTTTTGIVDVGLNINLTLISPALTTPVGVNGMHLDNICESTVKIEYVKRAQESYSLQVSRSVSGPWFGFSGDFFTTTATISKQIFNDAIGDGINGNTFQIRLKATKPLFSIFDPPACLDDRVSPPGLVSFQNNAPSSIVSQAVSPSCIGGNDGSIVVSQLKNADGSAFALSGLLRYTITNQSNNFVYNVESATLPVVFNNTPAGGNAPITAATWEILVEGVGGNCVSATAFLQQVTDPQPLAIQSASVSVPVFCTGGVGSIAVSVLNDKAPFTYTITGEGGFVPVTISQPNRNYTFTNLPAGNYQVKVQGCAQPVTSGVIALNAPVNVVHFQSLVASNVSCAGQSNGKIAATVSGGTAPYAVQWDGGPFNVVPGNGYTISALAGGNHQVIVRDANLCTVAQQVNVGINPAISGQVQSDDLHPVTCAGGSNGYFILTASGAAGVGFEYSKDGLVFQASNVFTNLTAGNYSIAIRDKNAPLCRWNSSVNITEPLPIEITEFSIAESIVCFGESTGELKASASGGNPVGLYHFQALNLTSGFIKTLNGSVVVFSDMPAGNYQLTVSDGTPNCQASTTLALAQPAPLMFHPVLSNYHGSEVSCASSSDGAVSFSSEGGVYPHRISISGRPDQLINNQSETINFSAFQAGDYFFSISDHNGACQKDTLIRLLAPAPLDLALSAQQFGDGYQVSCHGASNGVLTATAEGGTFPYSYSISPSGNPLSHISTNASAVSFSDLKEGNYTVSIIDVNNCSLIKQQLLTEPEELVVSGITKADISGYQLKCHGDQNASVTVFSQGGSYPQTMTLLSSVQHGISHSTAEGVVFNNLAAGNYSFQILDEEGCAVNGNFTLLEPNAVSIDQTQTVIEKPDCAGQATGDLHLQSVGGIGTVYNYQITYLGDRSRLPFPYPEQQARVGNPVDFDALIAGSYTVQVADQVGCLHTEPLLIATNNQVTAQLTTTDITCKSDADGSAALSISGGLQPYQIVWRHQDNTLQTDQGINENQTISIQQLKEGLYTFEVSDVNGCAYYSGNYNFQIEGPAQALMLEASVTQITCNGNNNGTLILQAQGGWQEAAYLYGNTMNQLGIDQTIYENLNPGIYRYFVKDNKGCIDTLDVNIHEPAVLSASIATVKNVSCYGLADGNFELHVNGGTLPYALSLDNGTTWKAGTNRYALSAAGYTVSVKDSNACATSLPVSISEPSILQALLASQQNTLCKQSTGAAAVHVTGGSGPYSFSWKNNNDQVLGTQLNIGGLTAGQYVFHVTDDHSCAAQLPVSIINTNDIIFDVISIQGVKCFGEANGRAEVSVTTVQAPYTIVWDNGITTSTVTTLAAGLRSVIVEDANQCQVSKSFVVPSPDALALSSIQENSPTCYGLCNGQLTVSPSGGTGLYNYSWQNNSSLSNTITNACAGNYQLALRDANNCLLEQVIALNGPAQHKMGIEDTTYHICQGQTVTISLPLWTQHNWSSTNGFSSLASTVTLNQAGSYSVQATDLSACEAHADFNVIYSNDLLKAEFLIPKEAFIGDTVVCVNISLPPPDLLVWEFDRNHAVSLSQIGSYNELVFLNEGSYTITLTSHLGSCQSQQAKTITIHPKENIDDNDDDLGYHEKGIKELLVFPNPNEGDFRCSVSLYERGDIHLRVLDLYGKVLTEEQAYKIDQLDADLSIEGYPSGLYWLIVETNDDTQTFKILVR